MENNKHVYYKGTMLIYEVFKTKFMRPLKKNYI